MRDVLQTLSAGKEQLTYEDYLNLPDDGNRYEIIEGVLYVANAPNSDHHWCVSELHRQIANFVMDNGLGRVPPAPFKFHLSENTRPVQPDILFVERERWPKERIAFFDGPPDLVVEVISPSSVRLDRVVKFAAYEEHGVREYWIVSPTTQTIEVYTLSQMPSGSEYALLGEFHGEAKTESIVLKGLAVTASSIFA